MNFNSLPAAKRIRLFNPNANVRNTKDLNDFSSTFEWNEDKILFLIIGYLRINILMGIYDISSIIFKYTKNLFIDYHLNNNKYSKISYLSDNTILCNFKVNEKNKSFYPSQSPIIFATNINQSFLDYKAMKIYKMKIKLIKSECNHPIYLNNGIKFYCGVIGISKHNNNNLSIFKDFIFNRINDNSLNDLNIIDMNGEIKESFWCCINQNHLVLRTEASIDSTTLLCKNIDTNEFDKCCVEFKFVEPSFNYSFKQSNIIQVCVENTNNNRYCVYFVKNDKIVGKSTYALQKIFENGRETLDFNRFDYLFALSCIRCDCDNCDGYEFKVLFVQE